MLKLFSRCISYHVNTIVLQFIENFIWKCEKTLRMGYLSFAQGGCLEIFRDSPCTLDRNLKQHLVSEFKLDVYLFEAEGF